MMEYYSSAVKEYYSEIKRQKNNDLHMIQQKVELFDSSEFSFSFVAGHAEYVRRTDIRQHNKPGQKEVWHHYKSLICRISIRFHA